MSITPLGDLGCRCRDMFVRLNKTCRKLGASFWTCLQDRLRDQGQVTRLGELIRQRVARP